ncbi:MAG: CARDB domain-containing protein [Candidatus Gracilibacteria bacterium]|nr:CARDB domain-containing protein [Candidatus Gracilibacteria bacterium]
MRKIISSFILFFLGLSIGNASPFDIFYSSYPDFIVSDIFQDYNSKDIYLKVCNIGGSMNEKGTMTVGLKIGSSKIISNIIQNVNLSSNSCGNYKVSSIRDMPVTNNGNYDINSGVSMKSGKEERIKNNNSLRKTVYLRIMNNSDSLYDSNYYPYLNQNAAYDNRNYDLKRNRYMPDLVVDDMRQDGYGRDLNIRICNIGNPMNNFQTFYTVIYNGNFNVIKSMYLMLDKGACTDFPVNLSEISVHYKGYYNIKVAVDAYKIVTESNENNNNLLRRIYLRIY